MPPFPSPWSAASRRKAYICALFNNQNSTTMAKGNMFLGMSRGSVGDVTFYRNRGNQVARARNRAPMNPKTEAQTIQRMILATASKAYSRMKGIVDHSFQGVQYGGVSQSYFLKRAMDDLRTWVSQTIDISGEFPEALRNPLAYRGLAFPTDAHESGIGLLISEGTIPSVPAVVSAEAGSDPVVSHFGATLSGETFTIQQIMTALGAVRGDQITCVGLYNGQFFASRYVINANAADTDLAANWTGAFDLAAFDQVKSLAGPIGIYPGVSGAIVRQVTLPAGSDLGLDAAAIIISRKVGDVWQRSTQRLVWLNDAGDYTYTSDVIAEWLAGTAIIDTVNPRYLNQAEQSF